MNKTQARTVAKQSTRHGYHKSGSTVYTWCPLCHSKITAEYSIHNTDAKGLLGTGKGKRLNEIGTIHLEMFHHLYPVYGGDAECLKAT